MYVAVRHEKKYRQRRTVATIIAMLVAGIGLGLLSLVVSPPPDGTVESLCDSCAPCVSEQVLPSQIENP